MGEMQDTIAQIRNLLAWPENWNSYTAMKPNPQAVAHAETWIVQFAEAVAQASLAWRAPSATACPEDGSVVFEWWQGVRKLTVYVDADGDVPYVQVWGTHVNCRIDDGDVTSWEQAVMLWKWLMGVDK